MRKTHRQAARGRLHTEHDIGNCITGFRAQKPCDQDRPRSAAPGLAARAQGRCSAAARPAYRWPPLRPVSAASCSCRCQRTLAPLNTPVSCRARAAANWLRPAPSLLAGLALIALSTCSAELKRLSWPAFSSTLMRAINASIKAGPRGGPGGSAQPLGMQESTASVAAPRSNSRRAVRAGMREPCWAEDALTLPQRDALRPVGFASHVGLGEGGFAHRAYVATQRCNAGKRTGRAGIARLSAYKADACRSITKR